MPAPRELPPPALASLYPPLRGYRYFHEGTALPFVHQAGHAAANRWWLAEHALLAYDGDEAVVATLAAIGYRGTVVKDRDSSSFAYVALAADHAVLSFRGTEAMTPGDGMGKLLDVARDWLVDARVRRVDFLGMGTAHRGFVQALTSIWPALLAALPRALPCYCTGHSLGGALAALAALRLARERDAAPVLVTFGQPRTGDAALVRAIDALPALRVVNACDAVPRLPPEALGYAHSREVQHLDAERLQNFGSTVLQHVLALPGQLRYGIGSLTPIELIDHAPLHYSVKCWNAALAVP